MPIIAAAIDPQSRGPVPLGGTYLHPLSGMLKFCSMYRITQYYFDSKQNLPHHPTGEPTIIRTGELMLDGEKPTLVTGITVDGSTSKVSQMQPRSWSAITRSFISCPPPQVIPVGGVHKVDKDTIAILPNQTINDELSGSQTALLAELVISFLIFQATLSWYPARTLTPLRAIPWRLRAECAL